MKIKVGIGQDSHAFEKSMTGKPLILAGIVFPHHRALKGNSDADVVLHAITNAISGVTGRNIIGEVADKMCQQGMTDSQVYLKEALNDLNGFLIQHVCVSLECKTPKMAPYITAMKKSLAEILNMEMSDIGITATTGEALTTFGRGEGIQVFATVSTMRD